MKNKTIIYTDGACSGNPGKGGWAAVIINNNNEKILSGSEPLTTNNKMELLAVIFTDSKYVKDGIESWIINWKKNGWMTAAKQPVKNKDLWAQLDELRENKNIEWKWVKGHSDNKYNNMVDEIARKAVNSED
jgi:ribonuclease HI